MTASGSRKKKPKSNGFVEGLKTEWNLFWETILGEEHETEADKSAENAVKDPFITGKLETLSLEQIKAITKALSSDRRKLNQRLEILNREIEENSQRLENLKLVGGESEETVKKINELNDIGQTLSEQLNRINERLKIARSREDTIKKAAREL
jgi:chromosome segregation ATPase